MKSFADIAQLHPEADCRWLAEILARYDGDPLRQVEEAVEWAHGELVKEWNFL